VNLLYTYLVGFVIWFVIVVISNQDKGRNDLALQAFVRAVIWPLSILFTIIGACL
jgi:hypothetical protein